MNDSRQKPVKTLRLIMLLGLAFAAGLIVAQTSDNDPGGAPALIDATERDRREIYSPTVLDDPYFVQQQRAGVEALEAHCRGTGDMCTEARNAREAFDRLLAGR